MSILSFKHLEQCFYHSLFIGYSKLSASFGFIIKLFEVYFPNRFSLSIYDMIFSADLQILNYERKID